MGQDNNQELASALEDVRRAAGQLLDAASAVNDLPEKSDIASISRFAKIALEVTGSAIDDLRENLISTYALYSRPVIDVENPNYSHLLLDKRINDLRDALLVAEKVAEAAGALSPNIAPQAPQQVLFSPTDERVSLEELRREVTAITSEVYGIKTSANQIGIVNINIEAIELKVDLASAIIAMREFVDALNLQRVFLGIKRNAARFAESVASLTGAFLPGIREGIERISTASVRALNVVMGILGRRDHARSAEEIWSESDVAEMLKSGREVPPQAAPYIRNLSFNSRIGRLEDFRHLTELRTLVLDVQGNEEKVYSLSNMKKLRSLKITISANADFSWINELSSLEELEIVGSYVKFSNISLPKFLSLENVRLIKISRVEIDEIPNFENCKNLKTISLRGVLTNNTRGISSAKSIIRLDFTNVAVSNLQFVIGLDELEVIDIRNSDVESISALRNLPSLRNIYISRQKASRLNLNEIPRRVIILGDQGGIIRSAR
ncbi:MAG: hypothetical protein WC068_13750 [Caulobacter sp.]